MVKLHAHASGVNFFEGQHLLGVKRGGDLGFLHAQTWERGLPWRVPVFLYKSGSIMPAASHEIEAAEYDTKKET